MQEFTDLVDKLIGRNGHERTYLNVHDELEKISGGDFSQFKREDIDALWERIYVGSAMTGRRGAGVNAISAIDMALWDIKGKLANMPVYDLLGGRSREAAPVYVHASGDSNEEVGDVMQKYMEQGFHHIRVQVATPGYATYGNKSAKTGEETTQNRDVSKGPIAATSWVSSWVSEPSGDDSEKYGKSSVTT